MVSTLLVQEHAIIGTAHRHLVPDGLWKRLTARIQKDHPNLTADEAESALDGALGFLKLCADFPGNQFAPSPLVDAAWHTFILYTREYQAFCQSLAGHFIHHAPNDSEDEQPVLGGIRRTIQFMTEHGVPFDGAVWNRGVAGSGKCTTQDCRDDCHWCSKIS